MKKVIKRYDNENYIIYETIIEDNNVVTNRYTKHLGGTRCNGNYILRCSDVQKRSEYNKIKKKYCDQYVPTQKFVQAVKDQSSIPKWARR